MEIYKFLDSLNIKYKRFDHPAVYTCEESNRLVPNLPGAKTKNLFLRDKKGKRHFLLVVSDKKAVDLKALSKKMEVSNLSFASSDRLKKYLNLDPGSVSLLAIINDKEKRVEVVIDRSIWNKKAMLCHPLVNTSTLVIPMSDIECFIKTTEHKFHIIDVPGRS